MNTEPVDNFIVSAEMVNIQQKLLAAEEVMRQIWQHLAVASEGLDEVQELLAEFTREAQERDNLYKKCEGKVILSQDKQRETAYFHFFFLSAMLKTRSAVVSLPSSFPSCLGLANHASHININWRD